MSRVKGVERRLESALRTIEDLDGQLAALRAAQGRTARAPAERLATPGGWSPWLRSPLAITGAGALLLLAGVVGAWPPVAGSSRRGKSALGRRPAPGGVGPIDLQAFRLAAGPESAPSPGLLEAAHAALDQGRLDEARAIYARVLAREPRNVEAITHLGAVLYQEHRVDEAVAKLEEALRIDTRYIHAHWDRAQYLFHGKRDFPAAARAAEAFLQVVPRGARFGHHARTLETGARAHVRKSGPRMTAAKDGITMRRHLLI